MNIDKVEIKDLQIHQDNRGHLIECWRADDNFFTFFPDLIDMPQMMYLSWTLSQQKRGPHLHAVQWDLFTFPGPGLFEIYLWERNKFESKTMIQAGADQPKSILVPPGIVHAYKNISMIPGLVINCPDKLYKGWLKKQEEDIIRFEDDPNNPYVF